MNSIYFLGYDAKNAEYFFCLHEPDKIFICYKDSYIDEDSETKWGYYNKFDELIDSLNCKGVKENILKNNIEELIREKLL